MTPEEYHKAPGLNSSLLSAFYESPDRALIPTEPKSYFSIGTAFECMVEDEATGVKTFAEKFFFAESSGALPEKLLGWIESGEDLGDKYRLNKDLSRSKTSATLHGYLDECVDRPGLLPIGTADAAMLKTMVDNFFKMEVNGAPVRGLLERAEFQVPIFWEAQGIKKKALFDAIVVDKMSNSASIFDLKTSVNRHQFGQMLKSKYWVQGAHYREGAESVYWESLPMIFLVSYKTPPYLAQARGIEIDSLDAAEDRYTDLVERFVEWDKAGRPAKGWLDYREDKIWFDAA